MLKITESNRSKLYAGFAGVAALALFTACGGDTTTPEEEPAQDPTMEEAPAEDPTMEEAPAEEPAEEGDDVEGAGENNATSTLGLVGSSVSWSL